MNSRFYNYVYLDPRKPGNYIYQDFSFDYEPFYVGKGFGTRIFSHLSETESNSCNKFKVRKINKIRSVGLEPIILKICENLDEETAQHNEIKYIKEIGKITDQTGTLVNLTNGGEGISGYRFTDIQKKRLSISHLGIKHKEESKKKISDTQKYKSGKSVYQYDLDGKFIQEFDCAQRAADVLSIKRPNISHCCVGKINYAGGFIWRYFKKNKIIGVKSRNKVVVQYDLDGNFIKEYFSISEAARQNKIFKQSISECCSGKLKTSGGFKWKYKDK